MVSPPAKSTFLRSQTHVKLRDDMQVPRGNAASAWRALICTLVVLALPTTARAWQCVAPDPTCKVRCDNPSTYMVGDIPAGLDQPMRALHRHLGDPDVVLRPFVERRYEDLAAVAGGGTAPTRGFFRSFVDEQHDDVTLGIAG